MATIHINLYALPPGWSDGTVYTWPLLHPTIIYTMDPPPLALLSAEFNRVPGYVHDLGWFTTPLLTLLRIPSIHGTDIYAH